MGCWMASSLCKLLSIEFDGKGCRFGVGIVGKGTLGGGRCVELSAGWERNGECDGIRC